MHRLYTILATSLLLCLCLAQNEPSTLTGVVNDPLGQRVPGVFVDLQSESLPAKKFQTKTDASGAYRLSELPPDSYTLALDAPGFKGLTVKSIRISGGMEKTIPPLKLTLGGNCSENVFTPQFLRLPRQDQQLGSLAGTVQTRSNLPIAGAEIRLICTDGAICGKTKTDPKGEFVFEHLSPGTFSLTVKGTGFYKMSHSGYTVYPGLETDWFLGLDRCPLGFAPPNFGSGHRPFDVSDARFARSKPSSDLQ